MDKSKKNNKNMKAETLEKYLKYGFIGIIVVVVVGIAISLLLSNSTSYAATIGSEKVSVGEFESYLDQIKYSMLIEAGIQEGTAEAETFWNTANFNGIGAIEEAKRRAMDGLKDQKIMVIKAKENKIQLVKSDNDYIKSRIDQLIKENGNSKSKTQSYLKENFGITLSEFEKMNKDAILAQKMYTKEIENTNVPEEEIRKRYDENVKSFDAVTVRHILISTVNQETGEALSDEKIKEAEDKAKDILAKVKAGEDMKKLAKEYSDDKPAVDENEGEYKFTKDENYVPEFMEWAFNAKVGDVDIVETSFGYHVMRLENREETPYDEVKNKIKQEISQELFANKMEEWKKDPAYDVKINTKVYDTIK